MSFYYDESLPEQLRPKKEEVDATRKRVADYQTAMCLIKEMYTKGIINKADYAVSEAKIAEQYGLSDKSIFRCYDPDDLHVSEPLKCE